MYGRQNSFVAQEGLPLLALVFVVVVFLIFSSSPWLAAFPSFLFILLFMIFRDPQRSARSVALGVFSPVDGEVIEVGYVEVGEIGVATLKVKIRVNSLGTYTARTPTEGTIKDLGRRGLWLQTDEGDDIVLVFKDHRLGLAPKAFAQIGERLGQGQRCAYLRLTGTAEIQLPVDARTLVEVGQSVVAGVDVIANVRGSHEAAT
ncbi:MAG: hypothetical protein P8J74_05970 [Woeseiaceae bacterium]|nr:hypothetical protein [Woeseiaceae bacterium]